MADELMLEIVTPEKSVYRGTVEEVTIPGVKGEFGVLVGHIPLMSTVRYGELNFTKGGRKTYYVIGEGYAQVTAGKVSVLVDYAQRSDEIDVDEAEMTKEQARKRLLTMSAYETGYEDVRKTMEDNVIRLRVAHKGSAT